MGSNVLSTKQDQFVGADADVEIFLEGAGVDQIVLRNNTDLLEYKKLKLQDGAECWAIDETGAVTLIAADGDGITLVEETNGTRITIAAAIAVADSVFQWIANIN